MLSHGLLATVPWTRLIAATEPAHNDFNSSVTGRFIWLHANYPLDPATITTNSIRLSNTERGHMTGYTVTVVTNDPRCVIRIDMGEDYRPGARYRVVAGPDIADGRTNRLRVFSAEFSGAHVAQGGAFREDSTSLTSQVVRVITGDWDGDRKVDITLDREFGAGKGNVEVWTNSGAGFSHWKTIATERQHSISGDVNNDGRLDILGFQGKKLTIYTNDGLSGLTLATNIFVGASIRDVALADLDADGDEDVVVIADASDPASVLNIMRNDGTLSFDNPENRIVLNDDLLRNVASRKPIISVRIGDLNGDGYSDLYLSTGAGYYQITLYNDGRAGFEFQNGPYNGLPFGAVVLSDADNNRSPDVVLASKDGVSIHMLGQGRSWSTNYLLEFGLDVVVADINGDGWNDLVLARAITGATQLDLVLNAQSGYQKSRIAWKASGSGAAKLATVDANGDGFVDLIVVDKTKDAQLVWHLPPPSGINNLTSTIFAAELTLRWDPAENAEGYLVEYFPTAYTSVVKTLSMVDTYAVFDAWDDSTPFRFIVTATNGSGRSASAQRDVPTPPFASQNSAEGDVIGSSTKLTASQKVVGHQIPWRTPEMRNVSAVHKSWSTQ